MYDLVTFGEAMVRLTSPEFRRLEQSSTLLDGRRRCGVECRSQWGSVGTCIPHGSLAWLITGQGNLLLIKDGN